MPKFSLKSNSVASVRFDSIMSDVLKDIDKELKANRRKATRFLKSKIKKKALSRKKTGNLAEGVYDRHESNNSYTGIRHPGYQAYILEFGQGKLNKPHPSVYNTFAEEADEVKRIMSEPVTSV